MKQEGSTKITIPKIEIETCAGCIFYDFYMVKSGFNPIYAHNCTNKKSNNTNFNGNLSVGMHGFVETPDWCP